MSKIKILMVMIEAGGGHRMPALAVKNAMERLYPDRFEIDVIDFAKESGALKADYQIKNSWNIALKYPKVGEFFYNLVQMTYPFSNVVCSWLFHEFWKKAADYLEKEKPDFIFATHYFCSLASTAAKKKKNLKSPVVTLITDPFDGHSFWANRQCDTLIIGSEKGKNDLLKKKVGEDRVKVLPFPVNDRFFEPLKRDEDEIRREYGIDPNMKTVLITDGGQGIGKSIQFMLELYRENAHLNMIAICGRNEKLKKDLEKVSNENVNGNLIPMGFVNNMEELLSVSDFVIGKAGVSSTFESLIKGKPILYTRYVGHHEETIVNFCIENRVGWYTPGKDKFMKILDQILNENLLDEYHENIIQMKLREKMVKADEKIARFIHEMIQAAKS